MIHNSNWEKGYVRISQSFEWEIISGSDGWWFSGYGGYYS